MLLRQKRACERPSGSSVSLSLARSAAEPSEERDDRTDLLDQVLAARTPSRSDADRNSVLQEPKEPILAHLVRTEPRNGLVIRHAGDVAQDRERRLGDRGVGRGDEAAGTVSAGASVRALGSRDRRRRNERTHVARWSQVKSARTARLKSAVLWYVAAGASARQHGFRVREATRSEETHRS